MSASENSTSGSVKGLEPTAKEENSELNKDLSSGSKDKIYKCDQCPFTFKRRKNLQKHVNNKHLENLTRCTKCQNSFDSKSELMNHMNKKHNKLKSDQHDDYKSVKDNTIAVKSSKDNDPEVSSEESDNNSESDISEPYICPECGNKCDDLETFSDHFKQAHNI